MQQTDVTAADISSVYCCMARATGTNSREQRRSAAAAMQPANMQASTHGRQWPCGRACSLWHDPFTWHAGLAETLTCTACAKVHVSGRAPAVLRRLARRKQFLYLV
jgi:hypothetical protein